MLLGDRISFFSKCNLNIIIVCYKSIKFLHLIIFSRLTSFTLKISDFFSNNGVIILQNLMRDYLFFNGLVLEKVDRFDLTPAMLCEIDRLTSIIII